MLRAVNLLKVLSILIFLGALILVYAYAPVMVQLRPESNELQLHRESFFYFSIGFFVIINVALLAFEKLYEPFIPKLEVKAWVRGFTFVLNFYLALLVGFIGVLNNTQHLSLYGFSYLNYFGPILIFSWIIGLFFLIYRKA